MTFVQVIAGRTAVVLVSAPRPELADALRAAVEEEGVLDGIVASLSRGGMSQLPDFVSAVIEGRRVRVLVRGPGTAVVLVPGRERTTLDGHAVTTWNESAVEGASAVDMTLGDTRVAFVCASNAGPVPVVEGTVSPADDAHVTKAPGLTLPVPEAPTPSTVSTSSTAPASPDVPARVAPAAGDDGGDFDFRHLLDETQYRDVEAAAVRPTDEEVPDTDLPPPPAPPAEAEQPMAPHVPNPEPAPPAPPAPASPTPIRPVDGPIIDAVPGFGGGGSPTSAPAPPPLPQFVPPPPVVVPEAPAPEPPSSEPAQSGGDEGAARPQAEPQIDDRTVTLAELRRGREGDSYDGPDSVTAVRCPQGHPNPPSAHQCRICGAIVPDEPVARVRRPSLGRLRFDDGFVVEVDRSLLLGRKPEPLPDGQVRELVALVDSEKALSRTHVEVRIEGWQVLLVDQNSVNGTFVRLPGQTPVKLRPFDGTLITPGAEVTLGETVSFVYEVGE